MSDSDGEQGLSLDSVFTEPPRPPTPPPTTATYLREAHPGIDASDAWFQVIITLVGSHPLWGHYLWNASRSFASYLDRNPSLYRDRNVLELGAGGGLPGIVAAKNGARNVVLTDYPDTPLIQNLEKNVRDNTTLVDTARVHVQGYIWGQRVEPLLQSIAGDNEEKKRGFDLIIMSDLIFNHSQHDALLKTCELTLSSWISEPTDVDNETCILVFYSHHRPHLAQRDMEFFRKATERGWACAEIVTEIFPPMFPEDPGEEEVRATVHGWRLTKRPQS